MPKKNELTTGYTSVLYKTPNEDIGFWYINIKNSYNELIAIPDTASPLLKSNMLMKLRETLLEKSESSESVTCPNGISRYPNNLLFGIMLWLSLILVVSFILYIIIVDDF
ncbi:MAG: hypothetical protein WC387_04195 [Candidatus Paceibacterota bacterium]|jgi:hypothetical protein